MRTLEFGELDKYKIDSHSSMGNNYLILKIRAECIKRSLAAADSMHINDIVRYYNSVEELMNNVADILREEDIEEIKKYRSKFEELQRKISESAKYRTVRTAKTMYDLSKAYFRTLMSGLQRYQFWFRISQKAPKGLTKTLFLNESVFGGNKEGGSDE